MTGKRREDGPFLDLQAYGDHRPNPVASSGMPADVNDRGNVAEHQAERDEIIVILPPEPPELKAEAARVLLRILSKAHDKQFGSNATGNAES